MNKGFNNIQRQIQDHVKYILKELFCENNLWLKTLKIIFIKNLYHRCLRRSENVSDHCPLGKAAGLHYDLRKRSLISLFSPNVSIYLE